VYVRRRLYCSGFMTISNGSVNGLAGQLTERKNLDNERIRSVPDKPSVSLM
jgi:hypothetical protein